MVDGFSSADPRLARGRQESAGEATRRRRSSGRSRRSRPAPQPTVKINGGTVMINGQGFSVAPSLQAEFIRKRTGGSGSSAQAAISQATNIEKNRKAEEVRKNAELAKLNKLKTDVATSKQMSRQEKIQALKQIQEQKIAVKFESKLRTGEILGFSGIGLSPSQLAKRNLLIKTGVLSEKSSRNDIRTVDPLREEFFIDTKPTKAEKESINQYIRRKQNEFNTEIKFGKNTPTQKFINRINIFQKLKNQSVNMENMIYKMRKSKSSSELNKISKQFLTEKQKFQINLIKVGLIPINFSKRQTNMALLGFSSSIMSFGGNIPSIMASISSLSVSAVKGTPSFVKKVAKDPKKTIKSGYTVSKSLGKSLAKGGVEFGKLAMAEPGLAIGKIGAEFFILKGVGKGFKVVGKVSTSATRPLNPFFKKLKDGKIILKAVPEEKFIVRGTTRLLKKRVKRASFKRPFSSVADFLKGRKPGQFKKFTKDPGMILKTQTVKTGATPISIQAAVAGEEVTAVNAAANQITGWIKRKKLIRKPIPGEESFPIKIRKILGKFDDGKKLTKKEFAEANIYMQKNVAPNITLLERSLYADPASGLRLSRLGIEGERIASLRDILRGNFRLKGSKPQISVFEKVRVEKFPKSLSGIKKKILAGKPLTLKETNQLIEWQVKKSGMFKPIGSTIYAGGTELEVTLAPGEIIKRIRKAGFTVVNGKKVPIVMTKIYKPSKSILKKIKLAQLGKLTKAELKKLQRFLSKQTNSRVRIETPSLRKFGSLSKKKMDAIRRRSIGAKPILRLPRGATVLIRKRIKGRPKVKKPVRAKPRAKPTGKPKVRKPIRGKPRPKPTGRTKARPTKRPKPTGRTKIRKPVRAKPRAKPTGRPKIRQIKKPPIIPVRLKQKFTKKTIPKKVPVYYIKVKKKGRIINLNPRPLRLSEAKDLLAWSMDKNLIRTAYFEPLGKAKKVIGLPPKIKGYFAKNKRKFRPYKIRVGKKKQLRNGFIEKRKYALDTKREKAQLRASRAKKSKRKKTKTRRKAKR